MSDKRYNSSSALDNDKPLISIIIVVYNAVNVLETTIKSLTDQTYKNTDLVVIDGGSTDGTIEILEKYNQYISYWKSEPDNGIYDAMNKGIKFAKGDWIYFLGAGDVLLNVLHEVSEKLQNPNYIYYGDVYKKDVRTIYDGEFSPFKLAVNNICHQAIFYPARALEKYNFEIKYKILADHHLNMQLYGDKSFRLVYIPLLISIYDGGGFSSTNSVDTAFFNDKIQIIKANFSFVVFSYAYLRRMLAKIIK
ncbi:MAG TPA: glycosyltransferase family 2 protein [Aquella sp.]|nr:glycosyltransferase family 2 protein [Aquella sp.]